uniref:Replication-associated protein n=1 Tax=Rice latent virus 1 TaxID=2012856 RepID=A0A2D0WZD9_9GEMI|nr:Rep [Rice latent virus 1]
MADPSTSHQFSVRTKYFFLTYPKCPVDPWELLHYLLTLLHSRVPIYILVTRESHKDGSFHLHTLLQLSNRLETKDSRFFDYQYYHRNCQRAQNCKQVRDYITKPGTVSIAEWGEFYNAKPFSKKTLKRRAPGSDTKDTKMRKIISSSTSKTEYLSMVRQTFPFDWATRLAQFEYSAEKLFPTTVTPYASSVPTDQLRCSEQLSQWATENIKTYTVCEEDATTTTRRYTSLYVCGPTRTGKTTWARSLGKHNYWNGLVDFTTYDPTAQYNVIDDIPFKYCPNWKQLIGCHRDYTVNPKYGKRKVISGGIPSIILVNEDEDWLSQCTPAQTKYIESNCVIHYMYEGDSFFKHPSGA